MSRSQDAMEPTYADVYRELYDRHWWWRAREGHVLKLLQQHVQTPSKILDVGCGDGLLWPKLEPFGEVSGIEPDASLVRPDTPMSARIEIAPFLRSRARPADHDLVLMLDVLEHIEDERAALARVRDLLKPGGLYVLTVPALMTLWSEFDELNGHFRRYTARSLRQALVESGFEILDLRPFFAWSVAPLLLRRALFRRRNAKTSAFLAVPPPPINQLLLSWSRLECGLARRFHLPTGSSLYAVARRSAAR